MYTARLTLEVTLHGAPDDAAAQLALAARLRALADDLERGAQPAPGGAADGCAGCWYVDQLAEHAPAGQHPGDLP